LKSSGQLDFVVVVVVDRNSCDTLVLRNLTAYVAVTNPGIPEHTLHIIHTFLGFFFTRFFSIFLQFYSRDLFTILRNSKSMKKKIMISYPLGNKSNNILFSPTSTAPSAARERHNEKEKASLS
jgi:hypothetical protein